ncbi:23S rRNA (pseudouridine(1915)-N(3))-methyltransferase RlmH [Brevibacillus reuszeri]|uniref:23S rRNA (pseudouridine(1915)-N(3))-methyltransferase RlmH n=1 Tax=Brevibacillus reuszeri TaxID=54915 RepID=UPI002897C581|nr:23S rRNA (pseudouridine(1915)-N(3))-methyltransferase RlmH [Brevibacillus reuszeri]
MASPSTAFTLHRITHYAAVAAWFVYCFRHMTLPHQLMYVLLLEQLYRAIRLIGGTVR